MMWAISLPGQTIDLRTVELLQRLRELSHVVVTRPSRATLEGVNAGDLFGELGERKRRVAGEMVCAPRNPHLYRPLLNSWHSSWQVRRYLRAELPGKLREHAMFYRSGYLDYPEWDSWWMTVDQYDDAMSDRDLSDSETDASDYISDEDMMDSGSKLLPLGVALLSCNCFYCCRCIIMEVLPMCSS